MRAVPLCLVAVFMLLVPRSARAQEDEARALFEAAGHACASQRWDDCADDFRRSLALAPRSATRLNLGLALGRSGRIVEAAEVMRDLLDDPDATEAQLARARTELDSLTPRIGQVRVTIVGVRAAFVTIAGTSVGSVVSGHPIERSVEAGECEVVAVLSDNQEIRHVLQVSPGDVTDTVFDFTPLRAEPELPALVLTEEPERNTSNHTGLFVGTGVAIAVALAGAILGVFLYLDAQPRRDPAFGRVEALEFRF